MWMMEGQIEEQKEELQRLHEIGEINDQQFQKAIEGLNKAQKIRDAMHTRRSNVITARLSDEVVKYLDDLVSANIAQSRSEAASILIIEGIKGKSALFNEIRQHAEEIDDIRKKMQLSIEESGLGKFDLSLYNDNDTED
ncbi:hypothetical protein [Alicyclobacillus fodiniaquatilis]|uniref:Uncharacterized protein n=1 Tax=Alicyclobacillus fodiniaquatilis TaxID=1661150 RepID=A0ABW4JFP6_9BACL